VSAVGANLSIEATRFINCSALQGGGAIAAAGFTCYGAGEPFNTSVEIAQSEFDQCSSGGSGGAVFVESRTVTMTILSSSFTGCKSNGMGGALAVEDGGTVFAKKSAFFYNTAAGLGGGALYSKNSQLKLHGVSAHYNIAAGGGGGVLFWLGRRPPLYSSWCSEGFYPDPAYECTPNNCTGSCLPCRAGTYHTSMGVESEASCIPCKSGTFASIKGATSCTSCESGKFSTTFASSNSSLCIPCSEGSFSSSSATACRVCQTGNFSIGEAGRNCTLCNTGMILNGSGPTSATNCTVWTKVNSSASRSLAGLLGASIGIMSTEVQFESNIDLELPTFRCHICSHNLLYLNPTQITCLC
jgi:predicted outer membrane repeat protein